MYSQSSYNFETDRNKPSLIIFNLISVFSFSAILNGVRCEDHEVIELEKTVAALEDIKNYLNVSFKLTFKCCY